MVEKTKLLTNREDKQGQVKIQQMMFMLIAVTLLFILVGVFFLAIRLSTLQQTATSLEEKGAMLLVSKLANSPEFSCENAFGPKTSCVDFYKVMTLKEMDEYANFWGVAKIEIRKIFPAQDEICTSQNYPDCGIISVLDRNINSLPPASNFVSLCRKEVSERIIYNKCELALLMVSSEDKGGADE
ncbi:MAG: hypothetical protein M1416_01250 [Candidatus Pacearchaeota archaeon]|nr:hypothetical protein [Candidatus Pacearchaeota archaeon]